MPCPRGPREWRGRRPSGSAWIASEYFNTLRRLEGAARNGYFVGQDEENARISDRVKPALWWADLHHLREEFEVAESLYRRLYSGAAARHDATLAARAGLGIMFVLNADTRGPPQEARVQLSLAREMGEQVLERFSRAPAAGYVAFMIAHSWDYGPNRDYAEAAAAYRRCYRDHPRSRHARPARFYEIFKGMNPQSVAEYAPLVRRYAQDFPDRPETGFLQQRLEEYRGVSR